MSQEKEINEFFECLGEIWRDTSAIEFFMRSAIAKYDGEVDIFPKPPYIKGKTYKKFPDSFGNYSFEIITEKFNKRFGEKVFIPNELVNLRNALAHGIISEIDNNGVDELVKFRKNKDNNLEIEFKLELNKSTILQIRQSVKELRQFVMKLLND